MAETLLTFAGGTRASHSSKIMVRWFDPWPRVMRSEVTGMLGVQPMIKDASVTHSRNLDAVAAITQ